jgi:hypothetical protein
MHYFSRDFLQEAARRLREEGCYHIARKKIPSKDGPVQVHAMGPSGHQIPVILMRPLLDDLSQGIDADMQGALHAEGTMV